MGTYNDKEKESVYKDFKQTRDKYAQFGDTIANAAGMTVAFNKAAFSRVGKTTTILGGGNYGIPVKHLDYSPNYLGSTKIFGPIPRKSAEDTGFNRAGRGEYGPEVAEGLKKIPERHPLVKSLFNMSHVIGGENVVDGPVRAEPLPILDPKSMTQHIKDLAKFLKADEVGVGLMPEYAYWTHTVPHAVEVARGLRKPDEKIPVTTNHKYVIGIIIDQNLDTILSSTGMDGISSSQSYYAYFTSGVIATSIASYIRNMGYSARAHHCGNYQMILAPALVSAGLGEMSRTGESIVHPRLGFRFKAAAVTTDMPLEPDGPISFGAREFCVTCKKCADLCPSGAISHNDCPSRFNNYEKWPTDIKKCTSFRICNTKGAMCGVCMKSCPWNNKEDSWFHTAGIYAASKSKLAAKLLKNIDDFFGYGTEVIQENRWWLQWPELFKK
ncbi:MAG: reductive dehalogenase [Dehalobacter sp.]|nr:reductive dehalogenase [Dehalobacter sp.]